MTSRALNFAFLAVIAAAVPLSAGIFSDGEQKATKGTAGEKVSYIEGTQKGIAPHTVGTLVMRENKQMVFLYAKGTVAIPYQTITSAEIGPSRAHDAGPAYKIWNAPKRFGNKTRYLTILYTENGAKNKLVFISYGSRELGGNRGGDPKADVAALNAAGINGHFYVSPDTAHEWQSWRRSLRELAPLLFKD